MQAVQDEDDQAIYKKDTKGRTLLHLAAAYKNAHACNVLCHRRSMTGALLNARDLQGDTALHIAAAGGALHAISNLFQDNRLNIEIKNKQGKTAKDIISKSGNIYRSICSQFENYTTRKQSEADEPKSRTAVSSSGMPQTSATAPLLVTTIDGSSESPLFTIASSSRKRKHGFEQNPVIDLTGDSDEDDEQPSRCRICV